MRRLLMTALCLFALPAHGADESPLRGQWHSHMPSDPTHSGVILIDASGRVTYDAVWRRRNKAGDLEDGIIKAQLRGYLEQRQLPRVEIVSTDGSRVGRLFCSRKNEALLHCHYILSSGAPSDLLVLTKVGPGPKDLMPAPR